MVVGYLEGLVRAILSPKQIVLLQVLLPCAILNLLFVVNSLCIGVMVRFVLPESQTSFSCLCIQQKQCKIQWFIKG